ncbi:hypothetical protein EVAR_64516_1 [Eumeta japonica]|uniref:Uncharacterized protein n=1 Tax=Eumeta variegata TaxID=151549 RepID=A0A4C2A513_EUMVA|nr:hypothetical protein EVAR_64516_1 [Eumeta japonica]
MNKNIHRKWKYPNISSAQKPTSHPENVPVPAFHQVVQQSQDEKTETPISSQYIHNPNTGSDCKRKCIGIAGCVPLPAAVPTHQLF